MSMNDITLRETLLADSYEKEIDRLKRRIKELEEQNSKLNIWFNDEKERVALMQTKLSRYEASLRFIATTDNPTDDGNIRLPLSREGMKAAAKFALAAIEENKP